uniref:Peptidase M1 membrane alanine aminopeptidase domain-containing protein n=1 Tax=Arcella intermedia TaxID=1963864 RepID=A0A6B2LK92_9EUKA|eukprot:TRINITY_DN11753_c0_g1_i1.p1 TRINITY_DN11753_c0_g1~~TRINITY_DN11753_c0_g1_i1.p1  ORF type:complete len:192 (-),score=40.02 TRINITY_DN11753_c0_g1_i1:516-1052(-)
MENWGCMHFASGYLLVSKKTALHRKQRIVRLIGHEIGHSWFGDLVTISSFKYLWLKEGFVRYLEYVFTNHLFPEWDYWRHFLQEIYFGAMEADTPGSSHPVEFIAQFARDIHDSFDLISYGKGACVVRMICSFIGFDKLWASLSSLMFNFKFKHIKTEDFWEVLSKESNMDIANLMVG